MYLILLHRDGARAETYSGAQGDPSPPYTGRSGGGGTRKRERTRSARSRDLLHHRVALSRDQIWAERGGTHRVIGHVTQASSAERCTRWVYYCPMPGKGSKYHWNTHLIVRKRGRPSVALALGFLLIARLLLILKGVPMKLKIVALAISVE